MTSRGSGMCWFTETLLPSGLSGGLSTAWAPLKDTSGARCGKDQEEGPHPGASTGRRSAAGQADAQAPTANTVAVPFVIDIAEVAIWCQDTCSDRIFSA